MSAALLAGATVLAGENQKSGPIGLAVILVLCVASYLLFRSMSRHMRKVRDDFPGSAPAPGGNGLPRRPDAEPPRSAPDADTTEPPQEDATG